MRSHHIVAIAVVLVAGFAVKVLYFSSPTAQAKSRFTTLNVLQMHKDYPNMKDLPAQKLEADPY